MRKIKAASQQKNKEKSRDPKHTPAGNRKVLLDPGLVGWTLPEVSKGHGQRCRKDAARGVETTRLEVSERTCNNTEYNKTDISDTESILPYLPAGAGN